MQSKNIFSKLLNNILVQNNDNKSSSDSFNSDSFVNSMNEFENKINIRKPIRNELSKDRFDRYYDYEYMLMYVPELHKYLNILTSLIIHPDSLSSKNLFDYSNISDSFSVSYLTNLFDYLNFEQYLSFLIYDMLKDGDAYLILNFTPVYFDDTLLNQSIDLPKIDVKSDNTLVIEKQIFANDIYHRQYEDKIQVNEIQNEINRTFGKNTKILKEQKSSNKTTIKILNSIEIVKQKQVIDLKEHNLSGYLVYIQEENINYDISMFETVMTHDSNSGYVNLSNDDIEKINEQVEPFQLNDKYYYYPDDYIVNFKNNVSSMFYPYGTSQLEHVRGTVQNLLVQELSMLIYRLTRAPERRIFRIDVTGKEPTKVSMYMQQIMNQIKGDNILNVNNKITNVRDSLSILDDYFIPVNNGTPLYEIDTITGGDLTNKIDDIQYFKDKLISSLSLPPSYFSPDNGQSGQQITQQDERVQREIVQKQQNVINSIRELIYKILKQQQSLYLYREMSKIQMLMPKTFSELMDMQVMDTRQSTQSSLQSLGIPMKWIYKHILKLTDAEIEEIEQINNIDNNKNNG